MEPRKSRVTEIEMKLISQPPLKVREGLADIITTTPPAATTMMTMQETVVYPPALALAPPKQH